MSIKEIANNLRILLDLNREIVGVKVVKTVEEYNQYEGKELVSPISYCVAVKSATLGHAIKINRATSGCVGGSRELNISMFCSGTRHKAGWGSDEVIIGVPIEKTESLIKGLKGTVNAIEYNDRNKKFKMA